jgi:copper chaperone CopZ
MKFAYIFFLATGLAFFTGCFRNDRRTMDFNVPALTTQECLTYLSGRLRANEGVENVQADFQTGTVTVTFNGLKLALKNIEIIIAEAGFDVNERPGEPAARAAMPAPCR